METNDTTPLVEGLLALDPGTGQCKIAVPDIGGPRPLTHPCGSASVPSIISYASAEPKVGAQAVADGYLYPDNVVCRYKRFLGTDKPLAKDYKGKPVTARRAAETMFWYGIKCYEQATGRQPRYVVICIPANFTDPQRKEMKEAAEANGLEVILMTHEPTAAALGNRLHKRKPGIYLIIDIGCGTTDVAIVDVAGNDVTVLAANGIARLGGMDFDERIEDLYLTRFEEEHGERPNPEDDPVFRQELTERIEQVKKTLSTSDTANLVATYKGRVCALAISREQFEAATKRLLDQVMDCAVRTLEEKGVQPNKLQGILAVGGASSMPMVHRAIEERFGVAPMKQCEQHFAAAFGGVLAGQIELERQGKATSVNGKRLPPVNLFTHEVTTHPLGVTLLDQNSQREIHSVLIDKGVPMPSTQTGRFALALPGQTDARIEVRQGPHGVPVAETTLLGECQMNGMEPIWDGDHGIEIRFKIDRHGMLAARAVDLVSHVTAELEVPTNSQPTDASTQV